jgi:hypothetical protein
MNEIEFNISKIIIANTKHTKNSIFLLHNVKGTITFYLSHYTHYTSVRVVNEIKMYHAKNTVYIYITENFSSKQKFIVLKYYIRHCTPIMKIITT